jgi:hypothetical protein
MTTLKKNIIHKAINAGAISLLVTVILFIYGYMVTEQKSQAKELVAVREEVIILKQSPVLTTILTQSDLIKAQRKQIDINTTTLAVLKADITAMNAKLDVIYDIVRDNNYFLTQRINDSKK